MKLTFFIGIALLISTGLYFYLAQHVDSKHLNTGNAEKALLPPVSNHTSQKTPAIPAVKSAPSSIDNTSHQQSKIVNCEIGELDADTYLAIEDYIQSLTNFDNEPSQLAYALFAQNQTSQSRLIRLQQYEQKFVPQPVVHYLKLVDCSYADTDDICRADVAKNAGQSDPDNGAMWLAIANYYAQHAKPENVYYAIRQLQFSPHYDGFYAHSIKLHYEALKGRPDDNHAANVSASIGRAAALVLPLAHITNFCIEAMHENEQRNQYCQILAEELDQRSNLEITKEIGLSIKLRIAQAQNNLTLIEQIETEKLQRQKAREARGDLHNQAANLLFYDQELFQRWLSNFEQHGELASIDWLIEEAITLSKNPLYQPCL